MQQVGTDRRLCGGATGGVQALHGAARNRHLDIMVMLMYAAQADVIQDRREKSFCPRILENWKNTYAKLGP